MGEREIIWLDRESENVSRSDLKFYDSLFEED